MNGLAPLAGRLLLAFALLVHGLPTQAAADAGPISAPCHAQDHDPQPPARGDGCDGCDLPCFANVPAAASVVAFAQSSLPRQAPPVARVVADGTVAETPPQRPPIS
jgi:hypothetical protein